MKLSKAKACDLMRTRVVWLDPEMTVENALRSLEEDGIGGAPVVDAGGHLVGVLSLTDLAEALDAEGRLEGDEGHPGKEPEERGRSGLLGTETFPPGTVGDWMTRDVVSVAPGDSLAAVCERMSEGHVHRVVVLEGGRVEGLITSQDVVRWIADHA